MVLKLSNRQMGTATERLDIERFADELEAAVFEANVGEYDGDELGGGECTLYFAGSDVDRLLGVLRPLLQRSPLARGARIVRMIRDRNGDWSPQRHPL